MNRTRIVATILFAAALASCDRSPGGAGQSDSPGAPSPRVGANDSHAVYTTFYPTAYFASRIAGSKVRVVCPLPYGEDPILWQPSREVIAEFQRAALIVTNGADFEKWVSTASLPRSRVVESARSLQGSYVTFKTVTHKHGLGGAHTHEGIDGHTWVDPVNATQQARDILGAMCARFPEHVSSFTDNFDALVRDLQSLHEEFAELTAPAEEVQLFASHPAYNYPSRRYNLNITNVALDPDAEATEDDFKSVADALAASGTKRTAVMLWESEPLPANVRTLRERFGVRSVVFSPCESVNEADAAAGRDYVSVMRQNIKDLRDAMAESSR